MKSKGVYFSFDALIGSFIIMAGFFLLVYFYSARLPVERIDHTSEDLLAALSELKMSEANVSLALLNESELSNSVIEQIAEFWATGRVNLAEQLFTEVTKGLHDDNVALFINENPVSFNYSPSRQLVSHKKMVSGIDVNKTIRGFTARAFLSKTYSTKQSSYLYFGGYVGDGEVASKIYLKNFTKIISSYLEGSFGSPFELYINNQYTGAYYPSASGLSSDKFDINYTSYYPGWNNISFRFLGNSSYIGGGYFRVDYETNELLGNPSDNMRIYLPKISGVVNLFDSFYVPGTLKTMNIHLEHDNNYPIFMSIGNTTIFEENHSNTTVLSDTYLKTILDYGFLSNTTIPFRIGHKKGNLNVFGLADIILTTEYSKSMIENYDIPGFTGTRLELAKILDKMFVDIVLNITGNRIGLVGYHANVPPGKVQPLTNNTAVLYSVIDSYGPGSTPPICYSCAIIESRNELLLHSSSARTRAIILMSDGFTNRCYSSPTSCGETNAKQEAITEACNTFNDYNIRVFAIAFGSGADNETLGQIATCGNGTLYIGTNSTELGEIYKEIAYYFRQAVNYTNQTAEVESISSNLTNSYIDITYETRSNNIPYGYLPIYQETPVFGNNISSGILAIPQKSTFINGFVTSYSSNLWTLLAEINNNKFFNLLDFGIDTTELGDPFVVWIPQYLVNTTNNLTVKTGITNPEMGSPDDKIIYTIALNSSSGYTEVLPVSDGCVWHITFYDNTTLVFSIPDNATKQCYFDNATYNSLDALDVSVYSLLNQLDSDSDGRIDVKFSAGSIGFDISSISRVPGLWGPLIVEVRAWH